MHSVSSPLPIAAAAESRREAGVDGDSEDVALDEDAEDCGRSGEIDENVEWNRDAVWLGGVGGVRVNALQSDFSVFSGEWSDARDGRDGRE